MQSKGNDISCCKSHGKSPSMIPFPGIGQLDGHGPRVYGEQQ